MGVAEQVVQVAERFLIGADQENGEVILLAVGDVVQLERALDLAMADKWSILPSESQVMSPSTACWVGRSLSR